MSYTRPTLISQIVQKGRKVSINPRNENDAGAGVVSRRENYEVLFRSSAKDKEWKEEEGETGGTMLKRVMVRPRRGCIFGIFNRGHLVAHTHVLATLSPHRSEL